MRLHLTIQRHGLPITRILWTTASSSAAAGNATTTSASSSFTSASSSTLVSTRAPNVAFGVTGGCSIAQLLEDVNQVVPLETDNTDGGRAGGYEDEDDEYGGQWGLEDYVVEVRGYECLHYMDVDGLLRDGDEVLIRALQSGDLKARRLTGRHQISTDGRHLIDGVPFGKPYYQRSAASRPAISIPPRKKRRLTFGGWDAEADDYDEQDDEEYTGASDDESDREVTGKELALLNRDGSEENSMDDDDIGDSKLANASLTDDDEDDEEEVDFDNILSELNELKEESQQDAAGILLRSPKRRLRRGDLDDELRELEEESQQATEAIELYKLYSSPQRRSRSNTQERAHIHSSPNTSTPKSKARKSSIAGSTPKSRGDNKNRRTLTLSPHTTKSVRFGDIAPVEDEAISSDEEISPSESEVEVSSSENSESSESSDSDDEADDDSESVSDASSDSNKDSASSSASSTSASSSSSDSSDEDESASQSDEVQSASSPPTKKRKMQVAPKLNPPGKGSGKTKNCNRRTKMRKRLAKMKQVGLLPPEANFADLHRLEATYDGDIHSAIGEYEMSEKPEAKDEQSEFEAKRQQLLQDLAAGGVNVDEFAGKENIPPLQKGEVGVGTSTQSPKGSVSTPMRPLAESTTEAVSESASKRMRLDVAGSRRLLFGSLGVKTPKTKDEEEATRKKLAGDVSNAHIASQRSSVPDLDDAPDKHEDEFNGDWEDKIVLKATECVHDDVPLATPPFPFVQRWDKDAQATIRDRKGLNRGRKRKRNSRATRNEQADNNNTSYFGGDGQLEYDDYEEDYQEQSIPETNEHGAGGLPIRPANDATGDSQSVLDDLPVLPGDMSAVPEFTKDDMKLGAIIAFKQLDMSKATNWQPKVSEYRVATVHNIIDDVTIEVRLARRDRKRREPEYDEEEEGPRVYSKFEMPGYDEDGDAEDDGIREISFEKLMEPKLLGVGDESMPPSEVVAGTQDVSLPAVNPVDVEVGPISSLTRDKISQLIQDAGFRSKIDSDLMGSQENFRFERTLVERARSGGALESLDEVEGEGREESPVPSPAFSGFSSSPPSEPSHGDSVNDEANHENSASKENSNIPLETDNSITAEAAAAESTDNTTPRATLTPHYPKLPEPSSDGLHFIDDDDNDNTQLEDDSQLPGPSSCPPSYQVPPAVVEESILEDQNQEAPDEADLGDELLSDNQNQEDQNTQDQIQETLDRAAESEKGHNKEEQNKECPGEESQVGLPSSLVPLTEQNESQDQRYHSSDSSTVTNPFYDPKDDSQFVPLPGAEASESQFAPPPAAEADDSDFIPPSIDDLWASTAPVRAAPPKSPLNIDKRRAFSSPGKAMSSPDQALSSPPPGLDLSPSPVLPPKESEERTQSLKAEPLPSQAAQGQQASIVVDLTLDSDPIVPPAGSDDDFVDSPGLTEGPGRVQKRPSRRGLRKRSSASTVGYGREDFSDISPPRPRRRGRPRKFSD